MTEAQWGLIVVTAIIIVFAAAMRSIGALRTGGTVTAIVVTIVVATSLFLTQ
ncbi:hypothetical protein [Rhodopseudomonas telluris]|uniref:Uncharacterized protein n=1 Tax=Rhodopseudomonas telluris TaxID=644215 RepID=A0ABV6EMF3_9BRAD